MKQSEALEQVLEALQEYLEIDYEDEEHFKKVHPELAKAMAILEPEAIDTLREAEESEDCDGDEEEEVDKRAGRLTKLNTLEAAINALPPDQREKVLKELRRQDA